MSAAEVAAFLARYAAKVAAPVHTRTTVRRVGAAPGGYRVETDRGDWLCRAVVLATGAYSRPVVPDLAAGVPAGIAQLTAQSYRHPVAARRGRRAGRRRVGDRAAARAGDPPQRPPGDARRRRTRADAARVPRARHAVVDAGNRRARPARRRGRRPGARATAAVAAARRHAGARDARPERDSQRRRHRRRPPGRLARRAGRCSRARCATSARSPTSR